MPGSDFNSSAEAELMSINLLEAVLLGVGLLVAGVFVFEVLGAWYGAPMSDSAMSRKTIHLVSIIQCSSQAILLCQAASKRAWPLMFINADPFRSFL
jgi:hypothetical protein